VVGGGAVVVVVVVLADEVVIDDEQPKAIISKTAITSPLTQTHMLLLFICFLLFSHSKLYCSLFQYSSISSSVNWTVFAFTQLLFVFSINAVPYYPFKFRNYFPSQAGHQSLLS
jgi:hypothetical protein